MNFDPSSFNGQYGLSLRGTQHFVDLNGKSEHQFLGQGIVNADGAGQFCVTDGNNNFLNQEFKFMSDERPYVIDANGNCKFSLAIEGTPAGLQLEARVLIATDAGTAPSSITRMAAKGTGFDLGSSPFTDIVGCITVLGFVDPCKDIRKGIEGLKAARDALQEELVFAPPGKKPGLIKMIKEMNAQIGEERKKLEACEASSPPCP